MVMFDGTALGAVESAACPLAVSVPAELYDKPGRHDVYLVRDGEESNRLPFVVAE